MYKGFERLSSTRVQLTCFALRVRHVLTRHAYGVTLQLVRSYGPGGVCAPTGP